MLFIAHLIVALVLQEYYKPFATISKAQFIQNCIDLYIKNTIPRMLTKQIKLYWDLKKTLKRMLIFNFLTHCSMRNNHEHLLLRNRD